MLSTSRYTANYAFPACGGPPQLIGEQPFELTGGHAAGENECPMEVKFAVLADYAILANDGKLSVLGLFDQINMTQIPGVMPAPMYVVVALGGEASEVGPTFKLELLLWDPDGEELFANEQDFTFNPRGQPGRPGLNPTHNTIIGLHGLRFNREGDHSLIVRVNGEERRRVPIRVNGPRPTEPPAQEQPS